MEYSREYVTNIHTTMTGDGWNPTHEKIMLMTSGWLMGLGESHITSNLCELDVYMFEPC